MCVILAGIFGFITLPKGEGREKVTRWAALWVLAGGVVLPLALKWYFTRIPKFSKVYMDSTLTGVRHAIHGGIGFTLAALAIALVCGLLLPRLMKPPVVVVLLVCAFGMIGAGEYLREFLRKPWVVDQVVYANDMRVAQIEALQASGVSHTANFT